MARLYSTTADDPELQIRKITMADLQTIRHSAAHILAQAVKGIYPDAKLGIGPAIESGFYYDFYRETPFLPEDLSKIEEAMREIIKRNGDFKQEFVSKKIAKGKLFKDEPFKLELLDEIAESEVSTYINDSGAFKDLCKGPHVKRSGEIAAFKLLSIAGAYWRGDQARPQMQRIYGTAFQTQEGLKSHLDLLEEAQRRDHRRLGRELELFSIHEEGGAGLVIYHPKGALLRNIIEDYERQEHLRRGYSLVFGPHILRSDIWIQSGHYEYYKDNMFIFNIENQEFAIKPMNCPAHILIYKSKLRSYRDLPLRFFELGTVYRNERSGVLHGLLRLRGFTQDDAHIFCTNEQLLSEIKGVIDFVVDTMKVFGFREYSVELSTRPTKSIGTDEDWDRATEALRVALKEKGIPYQVNEGDGAFYGPKIDIKLKDALGRLWQCATIQCDFALPVRFDLTYATSDGKMEPPIMLHRVLLGSLERFIGALIEHYGGDLPLWLSPVQVLVIPISDEQNEYANRVRDELLKNSIRVEIALQGERLNYKIRQAELAKTPYMLIVGRKEASTNKVALRSRKKGDEGALGVSEFIGRIKEEIEKRV